MLLQFAQARPGGGVVHGPVLEGRLVAAHRGLLGLDLAGNRISLGLALFQPAVLLGQAAVE